MDPGILRLLILTLGVWGPLAIMALQVLQATLSIVPFYGVTIASGYVFGTLWGLVYALIGSFLGSAIAFSLSRRYGEKVVLKFVRKEDIIRFQKFFNEREGWALLLARFIPIFPNNLVSFAAGFTKMSFRDFNIISTFGYFFQVMTLTYFGEALSAGSVNWTYVIIVLILLVLGFWLITKKKKPKKKKA